MLCCKTYSDDTQALINAKDRGGLWTVKETVQNIFIECENILCSFSLEFCLVFKYSQLVQQMQVKSIIVSNYDRLCWSIKPKVIKEISLNLLKTMLKLLVKVHMFSFARDNKEKDKVNNKKIK